MHSDDIGTATGYGALRALGVLANAFGDSVPSRADLDAAVRRVANVLVGNRPLKHWLPVLLGDNPAQAKVVLRNLQRVIDRYASSSKQAKKVADKSKNRHASEKAQREHAVVNDLKTVALFAATRFQSRALTQARLKGVEAPFPSLAHVAKLSSNELSAKARLGEEIPSGIPDVSPEISYLAFKAEESANDDKTEIGAALAGYSGACGCGWGETSDNAGEVDASSNTDEDEQLFLLLPQPNAQAVADAALVYPGAEKALSQGYLTKNAGLAARAFSFLRKQRVSSADILWATPDNFATAVGARRALLAANTLILHWARRFYDRHLEALTQARAGQPVATPVNPTMQLTAITEAKQEAASAAASLLRLPIKQKTATTFVKPPIQAKPVLPARAGELSREILEEAAMYGLAKAKADHVVARTTRAKLHLHLEARRKIIKDHLGLNASQAKALFEIESKIMTLVAERAGDEFRRDVAKKPDVRGRLIAHIANIQQKIADLAAQRRAILLKADVKASGGLAGFAGAVGDALGRVFGPQ